MLDLKYIREHADEVRQAVANKNEKADIDRILALDEAKRRKQFEFDTQRAEQNRVSKEIGLRKKNRENADELLASMQELAGQVKDLGAEVSALEDDLQQLLLRVPNLPRADVPVGGEDHNAVVRTWGTPRTFTFEPRDHVAIAEARSLVDFARGARLSGSGFVVYTGLGAALERALIAWMLDTHTQKNGYTELVPPLLVNAPTMTGTGQLPKLKDDMYHLEPDDLYLIPTAEVPVTNFHAGDVLAEADLPVKYVGYTPCFRREAGSYGKDTKGLIRMHQFNKVEMVRFTRPQDSATALEEMVGQAEWFVQELGLAYRVVKLATGDLSFASHITYDIEVWAPGAQRWLEVSSISDFVDFQARRANIRYRTAEGRMEFVHTLNGSGLATSRIFPAVLETWQREDGTVEIPPVLRPYIHGLTEL